jgi:hypothetical protein
MRKLGAVLAFCYCTSLGADTSLEAALLLLDDSRPPSQEDAAAAPWPAGGRDLWVVAAIYEDILRVAVLRERNGTFELVARSEGEEPLTNEPLWSHLVKLDLIPYRIRDGETAIGVRVSNSYTSTARSSSTEALHLYRLRDGRLEMVFAALTSESNYDKSGDTENESARRVVIVAKTKHRGFHDLLVRERGTKKTTAWRWNGQAYAQ